MHPSSYPPLRPVEPRPPILPAPQQLDSRDNYRLPSTISPAPSSATNGNGNLAGNTNAEAGPSSANNASKKRIGLANAKKRRANAPLEDTAEPDHTQKPVKQRESPKKKKAQRACAHCQKAHLTCDDSRPCQRCIKRGMADKCTEGHRKKAKYLLDEAELGKLSLDFSSWPSSVLNVATHFVCIAEALKQGKPVQQQTEGHSLDASPQPGSAASAVDQFPQNDLYFNMVEQPYAFGSEAANLEYASLSTLLGVNNFSPENNFLSSDTPPASSVPYGQQFANTAWPAEPQNIAPQDLVRANHPMTPVTYDSYNGVTDFQPPSQSSLQNGMPYLRNGQLVQRPFFAAQDPSGLGPQQNGRELIMPMNASPDASYTVADVGFTQQSFPQTSPGMQSSIQSQSSAPPPASSQSGTSRAPNTLSSTMTTPSSDSPNLNAPPVVASAEASTSAPAQPVRQELASDVYKKVTKSYSYIKSYQFLMSFMYKKFQKNDILRVIRALAIYRPSMIALQTPMSEEDFIFMEKSLRRSLIELEKLISYSGTPTVVWRRTGEICLVGVEFCLLTEWKKEDLVGQKYVYELFENQSVIEYWEKFASHAFENTTTSIFSHCVLLKPSGEPIPCTFCFSIRRDLFDLPSVVIGQWLPLM